MMFWHIVTNVPIPILLYLVFRTIIIKISAVILSVLFTLNPKLSLSLSRQPSIMDAATFYHMRHSSAQLLYILEIKQEAMPCELNCLNL